MLLFFLAEPCGKFPGAATRVLLPLNLAFNVFVHRTRAPLAWLLIGNFTVSGLLTLNYLPNDSARILDPRQWHQLYRRFGDGWSGRELIGVMLGPGARDRASGHEAWPKRSGELRLELKSAAWSPAPS